MRAFDPGTEYSQPKKRIFLRFIFLSWSVTVFTVAIFGASIIPDQKRKIISGMKDYSKLIHSAIYPIVSSSILLEDYGEVIENCLTVINENPNLLYVVFARKDGFTLIHLKNKWYQGVFNNKWNTVSNLNNQNHLLIYSALVQQEVFNSCYPFNYSGIDWGYIYIGLSTKEYHAELKSLYLRSFWIALVSVMMGLYMSYLLAKRLSMPIQKLTKTTQLIGSGDLTVRASVKTGDEIEMLGNSINQMVEALKYSRDEVKKKHDALLEVAHRAGMAEVAIDVLHNVGNVLNSINVISSSVRNRISNSRVHNISRLSREIDDNIDNLYEYLSTKERAKKMGVFLKKLSLHLERENKAILGEMLSLSKHINHIVEIVNFQQLYSKSTGVVESVSINELIHMAIKINENSLKKYKIQLQYEEAELPGMIFDRHKVIQIINNLISNAIDAVLETDNDEKQIAIIVEISNGTSVIIRVADNGIGIKHKYLTKIFNHGFTTKKNGHGFGLHSCSLFAKEMKGSLNVYSKGMNQGALFELVLPVKYEVEKDE